MLVLIVLIMKKIGQTRKKEWFKALEGRKDPEKHRNERKLC